MGCAYISTKGQLAPLLAKVFGKTGEELDAADSRPNNGLFTPCDLLFPPIAERDWAELGTLTFLIDDGDHVVDGDDVLVSQTHFFKGGKSVDYGFVGGRLNQLIAGYERGGDERGTEVILGYNPKYEWAVRFWAAIRALGTAIKYNDDPRLDRAVEIAGEPKFGVRLEEIPPTGTSR